MQLRVYQKVFDRCDLEGSLSRGDELVVCQNHNTDSQNI